MRPLFWYRRVVKTKDEQKKDILVQVWDCLHIDKIIRGHWQNETTFVVMMADGHEQPNDVERPVIKHGKPTGAVEIKREREWVLSQIELCYEDARRLCEIAGALATDGTIVPTQLLITQLEDFGVEPTEG